MEIFKLGLPRLKDQGVILTRIGTGYIVRKGREPGVATPVHAMAYASLRPYLNGEKR
jgi:hypothetical protein